MAKRAAKAKVAKKYGVWKEQAFTPEPLLFNEIICGVMDKRHSNISTAFDAVSALWPEEVWQQIVDATNKRGRSKKAGWGADDVLNNNNDGSDSSEDQQSNSQSDSDDETSDSDSSDSESDINESWQHLYVAELKIWFAILMVMGLCPEPALHDYWTKEQTASGIFGNNFIRNSGMSRNRWFQIRKYLFCDIDQLTSVTKKNSQRIWRPYPYMAIDETLLLFKGRFKYRQHIKGKPNATGLKIYALCDNTGYIYAFWFYQGSHPTLHDLVADFAAQVEDRKKEIVIVLDSFYGGYDIMETLSSKGFNFVMACQQNRPAAIWSQKMTVTAKGTWQSLVKDGVMALKFIDKKAVCLFTNCSSSKAVKTNKRNKSRTIPSAIHDYNRWMHGVDLADRYINAHLPRHKTVSWKRAMFQGLYYIMLTNAHLIYNSTTKESLSLTDFIAKLAQEMVPSANKPMSPSKPTSRTHLIVRNANGSKLCKQCLLNGIRSNSTYSCNTCNVALHGDCFFDYHTTDA